MDFTNCRSTVVPIGILIGLGVGGSSTLWAQAAASAQRHDFRDTAGDTWSVWTSPFRMRGEDGVGLVPVGLGVALTYHADSAIHAWMTNHEKGLPMRALGPTRDSARILFNRIGKGQYLLPVAGATYVIGRLSHSTTVQDVGLGCGAGDLASLGVRLLAYHSISRARPQVTDDPYEISVPGSKRWLWNSFFSGHIANSMACASFLAHRFHLGLGEPFPYVYATAIGLGRMADGEHWASDTMVGAIVGYAAGRSIAMRQLARESTSSEISSTSASRRRPARTPMLAWSFAF